MRAEQTKADTRLLINVVNNIPDEFIRQVSRLSFRRTFFRLRELSALMDDVLLVCRSQAACVSAKRSAAEARLQEEDSTLAFFFGVVIPVLIAGS